MGQKEIFVDTDAVVVQTSESHGRFLIAQEAIKASTAILRSDRPAPSHSSGVACPLDAASSCTLCLSLFETPSGARKQRVICSSCKSAQYCCDECMAADMSVHRLECALMSNSTKGQAVARGMRWNLRAWAATMTEGYGWLKNLCAVIPDGHGETFTHVKKSSKGLYEILCSLEAKGVQRCFPNPLNDANGKDLAEQCLLLVSRLHCNAIGVVGSDGYRRGTGVYHGISFANHACRPSCSVTFEFSRGSYPIASLRVLRNISQGDELTISYTESIQCRDRRQKFLLDVHGFTCKCSACTNGSDELQICGIKCPIKGCGKMMLSCPSIRLATQDACECEHAGREDVRRMVCAARVGVENKLKSLQEALRAQVSDQVFAILKQLSSFAEKTGPDSCLMYEANNYAFNAFISSGMAEQALVCAERSYHTSRRILGSSHPVAVLMHKSMVNAAALKAKRSKSEVDIKKAIAETKKSLLLNKLCFGQDSPEMKECQADLDFLLAQF